MSLDLYTYVCTCTPAMGNGRLPPDNSQDNYPRKIPPDNFPSQLGQLPQYRSKSNFKITYIHTCMHTCIHINIHAYTHRCMQTLIYAQNTYLHIFMHTFALIYSHIY